MAKVDRKTQTEVIAEIRKVGKERGYTDVAIDAILGNAYAESRYDPKIKNNINAYGIFQHLGSRLNDMAKAAGVDPNEVRKGKAHISIKDQVKYAFDEMDGVSSRRHVVAGFKKKLNSFKSRKDAAAYVARKFERPSAEELKTSMTTRQQVASAPDKYVAKGPKMDLTGVEKTPNSKPMPAAKPIDEGLTQFASSIDAIVNPAKAARDLPSLQALSPELEDARIQNTFAALQDIPATPVAAAPKVAQVDTSTGPVKDVAPVNDSNQVQSSSNVLALSPVDQSGNVMTQPAPDLLQVLTEAVDLQLAQPKITEIIGQEAPVQQPTRSIPNQEINARYNNAVAAIAPTPKDRINAGFDVAQTAPQPGVVLTPDAMLQAVTQQMAQVAPVAPMTPSQRVNAGYNEAIKANPMNKPDTRKARPVPEDKTGIPIASPEKMNQKMGAFDAITAMDPLGGLDLSSIVATPRSKPVAPAQIPAALPQAPTLPFVGPEPAIPVAPAVPTQPLGYTRSPSTTASPASKVKAPTANPEEEKEKKGVLGRMFEMNAGGVIGSIIGGMVAGPMGSVGLGIAGNMIGRGIQDGGFNLGSFGDVFNGMGGRDINSFTSAEARAMGIQSPAVKGTTRNMNDRTGNLTGDFNRDGSTRW